MNEFLASIFSTSFGYAVLRVTTPILFATLGALISNRAGMMNIGLEGMMLASALTGVLVSAFTHSAWVGLLAAVVVGGLLGLLLAYVSLKLKADLMLSGIALNLLSSAGTVFILYKITHDRGVSSALRSYVIPSVNIPLIKNIPVIGEILSGHNLLTYLSLIMVVVIHYLLFKTTFGIRIRSVGENPEAVAAAGINVNLIKYSSLCISGMLAGLGGAYMSMGYVSMFSANMTAGRGFIAIAAEAMGSGNPLPSFLSALLFGVADALSNSIQGLQIPPELIQMIPYLATIFGLILHSISKTKREKRKKLAQG